MRHISRLRFSLFGGLFAVTAIATSLGACGSAQESGASSETGWGGAGGSGWDEGWGGSGGSAYYGGAGGGYTSTSTGTYGSGGAGNTGNEGNTGNDPNGTADAGTDAAPATCDTLDQSKPLVLYISADDSNSMSSPVQARESVRSGYSPWSIRTYEFLNYYNIDYPAPAAGQLGLYPQAENGVEPGTIDLQIAVRSFNPTQRRPMTLTFVLDTSGSMDGPSIARERAVVKAVAQSLAPGDIVSMVTWSDVQSEIMAGHVVSGPNDPLLIAAANALAANGSTDLHGGLVAGYKLAKAHYGATRLNRVILVSDGGANTGVTDENLIALNSQDGDKEGIYLVGVGTGPAVGYNDFLMDTVTDKGRGAYVYIDSAAEAQRMFVTRFDEVMEIAARAVQVQLTVPWYFQMAKFYGEGYSTNPKEVQPQHLAPGDAMIFNQVLRACDPAQIVGTDTIKVHVAWQEPLTYASRTAEVTMTVDDLLAGPKAQLHKGKAIVAYAEALKTATPAALVAAHDAVMQANPNGGDPELDEIESLIIQHPNYP